MGVKEYNWKRILEDNLNWIFFVWSNFFIFYFGESIGYSFHGGNDGGIKPKAFSAYAAYWAWGFATFSYFLFF